MFRRFVRLLYHLIAKRYADNPLLFWKIFKIVLSKAFDLRCTIPEIENVGEPLLLYQSVG